MSFTRPFKIAIVGVGSMALCATVFVRRRIYDNFIHQDFYQKPLQIFHDYPDRNTIFGEPLNLKKSDLSNTLLNYTDGRSARIAVPLLGPRVKGVLHAWSSREYVEESWRVDKIDLDVGGKQWTIYINPATDSLIKPTGDPDDMLTKHQREAMDTVPEDLFYLNLRNKRSEAPQDADGL